MSCVDSVAQRLNEQRDSWNREFEEMVGASLPGNLTHLYNQVTEIASDYTTYAVDQLYGSLEQSIAQQVQQVANQLIDVFTFGDSVQVALFKRLTTTLEGHLVTRATYISRALTIVRHLLSLLDRITPNDGSDIVRKITASRNSLKLSSRYLKAIENGLLASPPIAFDGYLVHAGRNVEQAINTLGGDTSTSFDGSDLEDAIENMAQDTEDFYITVVNGIVEDLRDLAVLLSVEVPSEYAVGALIGLNLSIGSTTNSFDGLDLRIKSTARLIVAFPFHLSTLNHLINASYNRVHNTRTLLDDVKDSMTQKLDTLAVSTGNYTELYGHRVGWLIELNGISTLLGNQRGNLFGDMQGTSNSLINSMNAINNIIDYLGTPNYIKDINDQVDLVKRKTAIMVPSLFAAVANANAHARARSYLLDILVHFGILRTQDQQLLEVLRTLNNTPTAENALVDDALGMLNELESQLGLALADAWGLPDGSAVAAVASVLSPGLISNIAAPVFNINAGVLDRVLDDEGFGFENIPGNFFGGLGDSIAALVECGETQNTLTNYVAMPLGPEILPSPEVNMVDANQSIQNSLICQDIRITNTSLVNIAIPDNSQDGVILRDEFEEGIA